jgi:integrase
MPVRKRGQRWEVRVTLNGTRHEETLPRGASKADAILYEAKLRREAVDTLVGRPQKRTIGDLLDDYEEQAKRLKSYERDLRYRINVLRRYGSMGSDELPLVAERIAESVGGGKLSVAGGNRYIAILKRATVLARRRGVAVHAGDRLSLIPGEQSRSVYLTRADVDRLAKAAGKWGDLIRFAALTGLRRGEILKLTQEDIRDGCVVLGSATKSGKPRVVPLSMEGRRIANRSVPFGITATNLNRVFRAARTNSGLVGVRFHDLRRTYGTWLAQSGANLTDVRDLLGHSNVSQTNTYLGAASVARLKKVTKGLRTE